MLIVLNFKLLSCSLIGHFSECNFQVRLSDVHASSKDPETFLSALVLIKNYFNLKTKQHNIIIIQVGQFLFSKTCLQTATHYEVPATQQSLCTELCLTDT